MKPPLIMYGGAFDPVHLGHLALARAARDCLHGDVLLVPTGDPRHRPPAHAAASTRIDLLQAAIASEARIQLDLREIHRRGASYSVDSLTELRAEQGAERPLVMLIGQDSLAGLSSWHRWRELAGLAHVLVAGRSGTAALPPAVQAELEARLAQDPVALKTVPAGRFLWLEMPLQPQSSSAVRARCRKGLPLAGWVPDAVADRIVRQQLYGWPSGTAA